MRVGRCGTLHGETNTVAEQTAEEKRRAKRLPLNARPSCFLVFYVLHRESGKRYQEIQARYGYVYVREKSS